MRYAKFFVILQSETSGCSAVRLAHLVWDQGVEGSNPFTPTLQRIRSLLFYLYQLNASRSNSGIKEELKRRILLLDGAIGTVAPPAAIPDLLNLYRPGVVRDIHRRYLEAGADIISTNTFNSNDISLKDLGIRENAYALAYAGAETARKEANRFKRWVAGVVGPTSRQAVTPSERESIFAIGISFSALCEAYVEQMEGLIDGGVDIILIETVTYLANAEAAIQAVRNVSKQKSINIPVMLSATLTSEGRLLSGESVEEFYDTVRCVDNLLSVGLNCGYGPAQLLPYVKRLARVATCLVSCHPGAGLPDSTGNYAVTPEIFRELISEYLGEERVRIIGGCCGTTPSHIAGLKALLPV